jgi:hypothetical protein
LWFFSCGCGFSLVVVGAQVTSETTPIPHTLAAMQMSQYFANVFVNECRRNGNALENATQWLFYNYSPTYTGKTGGYFQQTYTFPIINRTAVVV